MKTKELYKQLNITNTFYSRFMKRFIDFMISLIAIIVLSPVLLIVYLLTIMFLGAPAIYKQARPGKNHKLFYIYKFRSMNNKKDKDGNLLPDAVRITKFGKFLRKTSLDELPQLFNILNINSKNNLTYRENIINNICTDESIVNSKILIFHLKENHLIDRKLKNISIKSMF